MKPQPPRQSPHPSYPERYSSGSDVPEASGVFHPVTGHTQATFLKGSIAGTIATAILSTVVVLYRMHLEDRHEEREAVARREEAKELRELRRQVVEGTRQPWAVEADGGAP